MKCTRCFRFAIAIILPMLVANSPNYLDSNHSSEKNLTLHNESFFNVKGQTTPPPSPYPIETPANQVAPLPYPIEEGDLQLIPGTTFSGFRLDPSRNVEEILALSSTGGILYMSKE